VLHRKGRPSAATSHESLPEKPSFLHSWPSPRGLPRRAEEQITRRTGLGKPLGLYPNTSTRCYTTTWCSNDPARSWLRRQRRHKNHHGHRLRRGSRFKPSSAQAADTRTLTLQACGTGTGRQRTLSTFAADTARQHNCSLRPLKQRHKARQKFCTTSPCSCHSLHETIPSRKDTCTPARSSDLSLVRNNYSFMHGMTRPANLRPRSLSLNHQRCRRRRGHAMQHKQGQTAKET